MPDQPDPTDFDESIDERPGALEGQLGISEGNYPQILDGAVQHALLGRGAAPPAPALSEEPWVCVGPRNVAGRVIAIAQDPTNPLRIYAGTAHGGLWRTADGGDTWEHLGNAEHNFPVGAIAIPEKRPDLLYIGTGSLDPAYVSGRGLYLVQVTLPHGAETHFDQLATAPPGANPPSSAIGGQALRYTRIQVDPEEPLRFWAASQTGLWQFDVTPPVPAAGGNPRVPASATIAQRYPPTHGRQPANAPMPFFGALPPIGFWPSFITDFRLAIDPRSDDKVPSQTAPPRKLSRYLICFLAVDGSNVLPSGVSAGGVYRGRYDRNTDLIDWDDRLAVPDSAVANFTSVLVTQCQRQPKCVYMVMANNTGSGNAEHNHATFVYRSNDSGGTWTKKARIPRSLGYTDTLSNFTNGQAAYDMVLEVNPDNPEVLICGEIDLFLSIDGGASWTPIMQWYLYDSGDYAQHGDQHAAIFDVADRRKIWVGNDGGLSMARDLHAFAGSPNFWRKRSHDIIAGQFQDITVHRQAGMAFMAGGGLQDNGTWLTFGGPTWYHIDGGDGGAMAIHSNNPRMIVSSVQYIADLEVISGLAPALYANPVVNDVQPPLPNSMFVRSFAFAVPNGRNATWAPFVPVMEEDPTTAGQVLLGWTAATAPPAPVASGVAFWLVATLPLPAVTPVATPPVGVGERATIIKFFPNTLGAAPRDAWMGTSLGKVFTTLAAAPGAAWVAPPTPLPLPGGARIVTGIAIHPADPLIVAVASNPIAPTVVPPIGRIHITYDRGATWAEITAPAAPPARPNPDPLSLSPSPVTNILFDLDPRAPAGPPSLSLFAGTLAGIYVYRDVPVPSGVTIAPAGPITLVPAAAFQLRATLTLTGGGSVDATAGVAWSVPAGSATTVAATGIVTAGPGGTPVVVVTATSRGFSATINVLVAAGAAAVPPAAAAPANVTIAWRPFNNQLPLVLVNDMEMIPGTRVLKIATFGRGIWECDLAQAPRFFLYMRQTVIEDARTYPRPFPFPPLLQDDPRLAAGVFPFDHTHAFDIRVDSPPLSFFDDVVDGVEFDEQLPADNLKPLQPNVVYVQVHNRGTEAAQDVTVHLYFMAVPPAPPPPVPSGVPATLAPPANVFPLDADPPAASPWQRVGPAQRLSSVSRSVPMVARFDWVPPATLAGQQVALLALCTTPTPILPVAFLGQDVLTLPPAIATIDQLIAAERRSALRIVTATAVPASVIFIRDGIDDTGGLGEVRFAGRSPDIIVVQQTPAVPPAQAFPDLLDEHPQDRVKATVTNQIYVRVFNRGPVQVNAEVNLWAVPFDSSDNPDLVTAHWVVPAPGAAPTVPVPPNGVAFVNVPWATPPDPNAADAYKAWGLVVFIRVVGSADPLPTATVTFTLDGFWQLFQTSQNAGRAALRVLRYDP